VYNRRLPVSLTRDRPLGRRRERRIRNRRSESAVARESPATDHRPLEPGVIAATSIGAFNSAILLSKFTDSWSHAIGAVEKVWRERVSLSGGASRNGVFRLRANPLTWMDVGVLRNDPLKPARDLAADAVFLAKDWSARAREFTTSSGSLERRAAELLDLSTFVTPARAKSWFRRPCHCRACGRRPSR
jgi:predicted acylesterase/phospholipase RssA